VANVIFDSGSKMKSLLSISLTLFLPLLILPVYGEPLQLPDIYGDTPLDPVDAQVVSEFPPNTFLENLVATRARTLWVNNHELGQIVEIDRAGTQTICITIPGKITGIAAISDTSVMVNGWNPEGVPFVGIVEGSCDAATLVFDQTVPEAAFLNGITPLSATEYLMADSYRGAIWLFDTESEAMSIWLEDPLLARTDPNNPVPAVNGLKRFGDTLYASNTQQMKVLRIPLLGSDPGKPEVFIAGTNVDDFAFDVEGNLYAATHIYNSIIRITPEGETTILATSDQGLTGSTAVAFGRSAEDRTILYAVTNGGMFLPPPTGIESGRLIRLEVGVEGYPLMP
jgi:hypothetical protein